MPHKFAVQPAWAGHRDPQRVIATARSWLGTPYHDQATEGAVIPRLYGRMRIGGNIIWATDFREETKTTTQGGGKGGGGGGKVKTTEYFYYASFAVALCEGPITGIGRIWADGKLLDTAGITWRWYPGDESQTADPFIRRRWARPTRQPIAARPMSFSRTCRSAITATASRS